MSAETYNLDFPEGITLAELSDPNNRHFVKSHIDAFDEFASLPYPNVSLSKWGSHLAEVVSNIYLCVKSLDVAGELSGLDDLSESDSFLREVNPNWLGCRTDVARPESVEDNYDSEDGLEDDFDYVEIPSIRYASPIGLVEPSNIGLPHWTMELNRLLKIRNIMPLKLRMNLIRVYYAVSISRGQPIDDAMRSMYMSTIQQLEDGYYEDFTKAGLTLPWRPFLDEFHAISASPEAVGDPVAKFPVSLYELWQMAAVSDYFDTNDISEIAESVLEYHRRSSPGGMHAFPLMLPMNFKPFDKDTNGQPLFHPNDVRKYLPVVFQLQKFNPDESHILSIFLSSVADYGLHWITKQPEVSNWGECGFYDQAQCSAVAKEVLLSLTQGHAKVHEVLPGTAKTLAYSLTNSTGPDSSFQIIFSLIKAIENDIFPLSDYNSYLCCVYVVSFCEKLSVRVMAESTDPNKSRQVSDLSKLPEHIKLSSRTIKNMVSILLPLVKVGIREHPSETIAAVEPLAQLFPELVLDSFLLDIYRTLEQPNSEEEISTALCIVFSLVGYMVHRPTYRIHVFPILVSFSRVVSYNGSVNNEFFSTVEKVANLVPFYELTEGSGDGGAAALAYTTKHIEFLQNQLHESKYSLDPTKIDWSARKTFESEITGETLQSASAMIPDFVRDLLQRLFTGSRKLEVFTALLESCSDSVFDIIQRSVFEHVTKSTESGVQDIAQMVKHTVRRSPEVQFKKYWDHFVAQAKFQVDEEGAGSSRTGDDLIPRDKGLDWSLKILCGALEGASTEILKYANPIDEFIVYLTKTVKTLALKVSGVFQSVLKSISQVSLLERRLISKAYIAKYGRVDERAWGACQFDNFRFVEQNMNFEWFKPSREHISLAVNLLQAHTSKSTAAISSLVGSLKQKMPAQDSLETYDQIALYLSIIRGGFTGITELFDTFYMCEKKGTSFGDLTVGCAFGDKSDPLYVLLHSLRDETGKFLHSIADELISSGNGVVIQNYIACADALLIKFGIDDADKEEPYSSEELIDVEWLSTTARTRTLIGSGLYSAHVKCMLHSRCSRVARKLDIDLLGDLVKLATTTVSLNSVRACQTVYHAFTTIHGATSVLFDVLLPIWKKTLSLTAGQNKKSSLEAIYIFLRGGEVTRIFMESVHALEFFELALADDNYSEVTSLVNNRKTLLLTPSDVCTIREDMLAPLAPGSLLDDKIERVKAAKAAKREMHRDMSTRIVNFLVKTVADSQSQELITAVIGIVSLSQINPSVTLNAQAIDFVAKTIPNLRFDDAKMALFHLTGILNRIIRVAVNYNHDINRWYSVKGDWNNVHEIDVMNLSDPSAFFEKEFREVENPAFYLDGPLRPELFWPRKLPVVSAKVEPVSVSVFTEEELEILKLIGDQMSKEFLKKIYEPWCEEDNMVAQMVSPLCVNTVAVPFTLVLLGLTPMTVDDFLQFTTQLFDLQNAGHGHHSMMTVLLTGMMVTYPFMNSSVLHQVDKHIAGTIREIWNGPLETHLYKRFIVHVMKLFDIRRFPLFLREITMYDLGTSPGGALTRIEHQQVFFSYNGRLGCNRDVVLAECARAMATPYITESNAKLFGILCQTYPAQQPSSYKEYMALKSKDSTNQNFERLPPACTQAFEFILDQVELHQKHGTENLPIAIKFVIEVLQVRLSSTHLIDLTEKFDARLMNFFETMEKNRDQQMETRSVYAFFAMTPLSKINAPLIRKFVSSAGEGFVKTSAQQAHALVMVKTHCMKNFYDYRNKDWPTLLASVEKLMLSSEYAEIRVMAAEVLKVLLLRFPFAEFDHKVTALRTELLEILDKDRFMLNIFKDRQARVHGAILGLGALIDEVYDTKEPVMPPAWVTRALVTIAEQGVPLKDFVGESAKSLLKDFKSRRKTSWDFVSQCFTEDQLTHFEGLSSSSLYL